MSGHCLLQEQISVTIGIFTVKKECLNVKEFLFVLNFSTVTCLALPAAGKSELRAVSLRGMHLQSLLLQDEAANSLSALWKYCIYAA